MAKRYIRRLKVIVTVFLLATLTVIVGARAELENKELRVESASAAPEIYPMLVQAFTSIEESETENVAPTPTTAPMPTPTPVPLSTHTPTSTPMPEQTPAVAGEEAEEGRITAPVNGGYGDNYIPSTVSERQEGGSSTGKINVAHHVRLTAYCSCEICCGYWALIRPVDEYGNKIVYTSTGALAVQGSTVAVNPRFIPHGSYVYVQDPNTGEWREYKATDTSGTMNHVDIYYNDHTAALHSGYGGYGTVYWSAEPIDLKTLAVMTPGG